MVKRKVSGDNGNVTKSIPVAHQLSDLEISEVRSKLLAWYDANKRDLPWRKQASNPDINQRAYAVWVSEIMLQQTQVATVINYYNKWMKKWPTLQDLASASLEEVNEMWSGLGYYSRGRRLFEGAKKVVDELDGEMPKDADSLLKHLPGVGKYTAGAIASIAYNQCTGLVDGNVIRVLSRLRMIGADSTSQPVIDALWSLANAVVDKERPGDFNQSLMELGATVCTPKSPDCAACPLRNNCKAYAKVEQQRIKNSEKLTSIASEKNAVIDIECLADQCSLCLPDMETYDDSAGVTNYPRKGKKRAPREERTAVCVLCRKTPTDEEFLIRQRPEKGLLAGLWEFPSKLLVGEGESLPYSDVLIEHGVEVLYATKKIRCGEVVHIFSHIHQTYDVEGVIAGDSDIQEDTENRDQARYRWVTRQQFSEAAVSTAMRKVFKAFESATNPKTPSSKDSKLTKLKPKEDKNQKSIASFFKPKTTA
ncbi:adenine DNA glycosylase-like [Mya arenaria]|uniref:adenine DNA glycosylase-like n=1 Tax=Mya arenaria TaxID=6604 RepID=UPI0022E0BA0F|nr:adenine DNA glycosylase-like [Mya arenaria]